MIEPRLVNNLSNQMAPIGYVEPILPTVTENISLIDKSLEVPENSILVSSTELIRTAVPGSLPTSLGSIPPFIYSKDIVLGNKAVLTKDINEEIPLFYKYYLGRIVAFFLASTSGTVSVTIDTTQITFNSTTVTYTGKSVREIVKEINDANDGLKAFLVSSLPRTNINTISLKTGTYSVGTSGTNIDFDTDIRVHSPTASTSDLDLARETIKKEVEVLIDGQKTARIKWDLYVESYDTNGFRVALYLDKKFISGKTIQVKYRGINSQGNLFNDLIEVVNPEPYLFNGFHYNLKEHSDSYFIEDLNLDPAPAIGLFARTGSVSVSVNSSDITIDNTPITYTGKSVPEVVSEINETVGSSVKATVLSKSSGDLVDGSFTSSSFTVKTSGNVITYNDTVFIRFNSDIAISPQLPYDEEPHKPWYPRIRNGSFSKFLETSEVFGYGSTWGHSYGGTLVNRVPYIYSVPEYDKQLFHKTIGQPFRYVPIEDLSVVELDKLRTNRSPLESAVSLTLYLGDVDISSKIKDIDLNNGFIFLSEKLQDYTDIQASYVYEERSYIYTGIDLNPIDNPSLINKYIGVYLIPSRVGDVYWGTSTTVYHIITDTVEDLESALSNLTFSNNIQVHPIILGIYKISANSSKEDVKITPLDIKGGGVREGTKLEEDSNFIFDHGRWDGIPFQAQAGILVEVPKSLLRTAASTTPYWYDHTSTNTFMNSDGQWTIEEIKERVKKWAASGTGIVVDTE